MSNAIDFLKARAGLNPLREWNQMQRVLDRWYDEFGMPGPPQGGVSVNFNPTCEVSEDKNQYMLRFDLPGIPKDQIKIELDDNRLTVSGERREERKEDEKDKKRHFSEISYGSFMRSFTFPTPVSSEKVSATYDHGVLSIAIAKAEQSKVRQIAVK